MLEQFNGPRLTDGARVSPEGRRASLTEFLDGIEGRPPWLLMTETINEAHGREIRRYARDLDIRLGAIFHDSIAVLHPEFCSEPVARNHGDYMRGLAECDVVIPNSYFSARCLEGFWRRENITGCPVVADVLPGEFGGYARSTAIQSHPSDGIRILCVSTLEPRKNHMGLIQAVQLMQKRQPELRWSLTLVGNRYAGALEIADAVEAIAAKNPSIRWLGIVDDETLHRLYEEATFTVYASIIEGFGMPVMESIWHSRPCICHKEGVMAEHASGGGCLTTDVTDIDAFSDAIYRLATDRELLLNLAGEAAGRKIKTWDDYAVEFLSIIRKHTKPEPPVLAPPRAERRIQPDWQDIVYPGCLCDNWQMNDSERLALTALLSRLRPRCSIEVGTFEGGSLSLISQYSEMVFSIDIDPRVSEKFSRFRNVSFLTGPSAEILPLLLKELDAAGVPVEFILLDGDHSAEGIKADLNAVLSYAPQKPLVVMMHGSFNPECRRGMLEADWKNSSHVDWVDIDFIPGRIVEHGGGGHGEMWGGLGLVYLLPTRREKPLSVNRSVEAMFREIRDSL
jgi:glycosyltransferase involved in cell wall biosynthesis